MSNKKLPYEHIALIYNPNSTRPAAALAQKLAKRLRRLTSAETIHLYPTEKPGHGEEIAEALAIQFRQPLIISVSGDGGYHEVINGVMAATERNQTKRPVVAVEAAGNANDHYRQMRSETLYKAIRKDVIQPLEVIKVTFKSNKKTTVRYAHSYFGVGLTPLAVKELNKQKLNPFNEKLIVAREIIAYKPVAVKLNGAKASISNIIAARVGRMSKVLKLNEQQKQPPPGTFQLFVDASTTRRTLIKQLAIGVTRGLQDKSRLVKRCRIALLQDTSVQLDGEVYNVKAGTVMIVSIAKDKLLSL